VRGTVAPAAENATTLGGPLAAALGGWSTVTVTGDEVAALGGTVRLESTVGKGTTVTCELPQEAGVRVG